MNDNPLNIWQLHVRNSEARPFRDGVDRAIGKVFPLVAGDYPERIAQALQALEAAMGERLSDRLVLRRASGGTPRNAAHWHLMTPMATMTGEAYLPHRVRHGLMHPYDIGLRS